MMGPSLVAGGGGTVITAIVDRILYDQSTGSDNYLITASGSLASGRNTLLDIARNMRPLAERTSMSVDNVFVEVRTVGGGAGGAYGGYQPFGGYPGLVVTKGFWLHELPDTPITYVIGAGAASGGAWGGQTTFGSGRHLVRSAATPRGGNSPLEHYKLGAIAASWDSDNSLPPMLLLPLNSVTGFDSFDFAWHSNRGPGGGGSTARDSATSGGATGRFSRYGGQGSRQSPSGATNGGVPVVTDATRHGSNHNPLYFDSFGGGGAAMANASYAPGAGGFPGGAGGSGHNDGGGTIGGSGGDGCIKLRFRRREIK